MWRGTPFLLRWVPNVWRKAGTSTVQAPRPAFSFLASSATRGRADSAAAPRHWLTSRAAGRKLTPREGGRWQPTDRVWSATTRLAHASGEFATALGNVPRGGAGHFRLWSRQARLL